MPARRESKFNAPSCKKTAWREALYAVKNRPRLQRRDAENAKNAEVFVFTIFSLRLNRGEESKVRCRKT
jgi:hypothetical protein